MGPGFGQGDIAESCLAKRSVKDGKPMLGRKKTSNDEYTINPSPRKGPQGGKQISAVILSYCFHLFKKRGWEKTFENKIGIRMLWRIRSLPGAI